MPGQGAAIQGSICIVGKTDIGGGVLGAMGSCGRNSYGAWVWWLVKVKVLMVRTGKAFSREWCLIQELKLDKGKGFLCRRHSLCKSVPSAAQGAGVSIVGTEWGSRGRGQVMPLNDCSKESLAASVTHSSILSSVISLAPRVLETLSLLGTEHAQ